MPAKVFFKESDDVVDIRKDNVFKAVFTKDTPASKKALSKFISAMIQKEVSIVSISGNEPPADNLRDRQIRFDISCKTENGELVNVEMSVNPKPFEPVRLEFYAAKLFIGQDIRGKEKNYNNLKRAYQIAILANECFFGDEEFFHTFEYYDPEKGVSLNGKTRIITLELSKLEKVVEKPAEQLSSQESWGIFFQYLTDKKKREKINKIAVFEEGIAMASEAVMAFSKDEIEYFRQMSIEKNELDLQSEISYARSIGMELGRAEGQAKRSIEIAKRLKACGYSLEEIAKNTDLSLEVVEKL